MFRDKLGQLHICLVVLVGLLVHVATAQPLAQGGGGGSRGTAEEQGATGDDNRKSIANMNLNSRISGPGKFETRKTGTFPCYNKNVGEHVRISDALRSRRSPKVSSLPSHPQPPSAELQTIMSGNWQAMDPESLFKLLNTLASSKETLPEDFYPFDDEDDDDPIDLVYSGTPPLVSSPSSKSSVVSSSPFRGAAANQPPPLAEPITLMRSNLGGSNKVYKFMDDEDEDDAQPLQMHRMVSKTKKHFPMYKRAYMPRNLWPQRDLVQLPNGEIAFTPHGLRVLRYHQPMPLPLVDADLPLVRRPVL